MGFLDRYLIVLSDEVRVWDVVTSIMVFSRPIGTTGLTLAQRIATSHLAVSVRTQTFAVAGINLVAGERGTSVLVFQPTDAEPVLSYQLRTGAVAALTHLVDGSGYVVLDSQAEIRRLTTHVVPVLSERLRKTKGSEEEEEEEEELPAITFRETNAGDEDAVMSGTDRQQQISATGDDRPTVQSEQLAKVLANGSSGFGLPNLKEMFDGVASLFAVKVK
jgi:hypothetical protein